MAKPSYLIPLCGWEILNCLEGTDNAILFFLIRRLCHLAIVSACGSGATLLADRSSVKCAATVCNALKSCLQHVFDYNLNLVFGITFLVDLSAILWLGHDWTVVTGGGNLSTRRKPPPNPKTLATFSHDK